MGGFASVWVLCGLHRILSLWPLCSQAARDQLEEEGPGPLSAQCCYLVGGWESGVTVTGHEVPFPQDWGQINCHMPRKCPPSLSRCRRRLSHRRGALLLNT